MLKVLSKRFSNYGLTLHPEKTRLVKFGRAALEEAERVGKAPDTFDFLGLTHIPERSRRGFYRPGGKTMKKRLRRGLKEIGRWCKQNRRAPVRKQHETLSAKLRGHYQYYGRSSNFRSLWGFYNTVKRVWRKWLSRSTRGAPMSWKQFADFLSRHPLLMPNIAHTWAGMGRSA